ncbi:hypothetical protein P9875_18280 [Janthinobacterium rivuli]|uniref:DUF3829 domain-containing protein n=1 Tax=Janthinobacterium rivuli TaxID=2751478 RepID=A0ABY8HYF9_9BURK|nr:hypothetical protein [Janthinobacterium rivuli]WFR77670.1 hypothetical protein P9875_18280 [Janthinobacterium rivuli]
MTTICACLLIGGMTSACKNFTPVDKFAGQTVAVTEVFKPILTHSMSSCTNNVRRNSIITDRPYLAQETEQDLLRRCQAYATQLAGTAELNNVLKRYAEVLAALANDKLANYKEEIGALGGSLDALQQSSGMTPVLDADQLDKVTRLSALISQIVTQHRQQSGINELLAREEDIYIISNALKKYAQQNYEANLHDENLTLASLNRSLDNAAAREPVASNYLKAKLYLDGRQLQERGKVIDAYIAAMTGLQNSLSTLRAKSMKDPALERQLDIFAKQVDTLQKQAANYSPSPW